MSIVWFCFVKSWKETLRSFLFATATFFGWASFGPWLSWFLGVESIGLQGNMLTGTLSSDICQLNGLWCLWIPYDMAKPLLDRRKYVVLSDLTALQNGDSLQVKVIDNIMEEQQNEDIQKAPNDVFVNDEEMDELEYEDSDDESDLEASDDTITDTEHGDISNVLIGVKEARLRYKDIQHAFDSSQRKYFENQLQRYTSVVGTDLSEQMVYSIG